MKFFNNIKSFFRVIQIQIILVRFGIDEIILSVPYLKPFQFFSKLNPWQWRQKVKLSEGEKVRRALEALGPIFVKFGQTLSMRNDLFSEEFITELSKLQDQVPPFDGKVALTIIESELGKAISDVFLEVELEPLASASIAQVHAAKLQNGREVVIKVLRPEVENIIKRDISLLYSLARILDKYWSGAKAVHPIDIVEEFERNILGELDLLREAGNASQLRHNFKDNDHLYIPEVFWDYTSKNVLVIERIYGLPISDITVLKTHRINLKKLAELGIEIFFTQVFRDCFFHADMHPGNIFINQHRKEDPQYIIIDFGIVGTLSIRDQRYLAENFLAFFRRDYYRVAQLHIESGWLPPDVRPDTFASAIRTVCEPIFEKPLKDISFGKTLMRLFQTARHFHIQIQPQLILLQKTLFNIEGLGRKLYPDLDLWATAKPYLERWVREQYSPIKLYHKIQKQLPYWLDKMPEMPDLLHESLQIYVSQYHIDQFIKKNRSGVTPKKNKRTSIWWLGFILVLFSLMQIYFFEKRFFDPLDQWFFTGFVGLLGIGMMLYPILFLPPKGE